MAGGGYTFSQVPMADIPRSSFNRSHGHKTTFDAGYLVPIFVDEALPGDTFNVHSSIFARLATPIAPVMDNLHMEMFYFAVPHRLVGIIGRNSAVSKKIRAILRTILSLLLTRVLLVSRFFPSSITLAFLRRFLISRLMLFLPGPITSFIMNGSVMKISVPGLL